MSKFGRMLDGDCLAVLLASGSFLGVQLADLDLVLKILVSAATLIFVGLKIWKLWQRGE